MRANTARVKGSIPYEQTANTARPVDHLPLGLPMLKMYAAKSALDKNVHQLAHAMLTTLEGIVPQ